MIHLDIITPDSAVFTGDVDAVTLPTMEGEITVMGGHVPLIAVLGSGTLVARQGKEEKVFAVSRGTIEITGSSIKVLSDIADRMESLEEAAIDAARKKAEDLRSQRREDTEGFAEATALLERELARLKTVRRRRKI